MGFINYGPNYFLTNCKIDIYVTQRDETIEFRVKILTTAVWGVSREKVGARKLEGGKRLIKDAPRTATSVSPLGGPQDPYMCRGKALCLLLK